MKIRIYPDPVLLEVCKPIDTVPPCIIDEMFNLMGDGLGLAAPQVGLPYRFFIMQDTVFINPEILEISGLVRGAEACFSLPGIMKNVTRAANVRMGAYDMSGVWQVYRFVGLAARVVQHEYDHLNGILIA
jgi:peptide deformylase